MHGTTPMQTQWCVREVSVLTYTRRRRAQAPPLTHGGSLPYAMRGFARGRARRLTGSAHNDNVVRNPTSTRSVGTRLRLRLGLALIFGKEEAHEYRHTRPHTHRAYHRRLVYSKFKTLPGKLELPTLRLTASRSNQLSYGSMFLIQRR